MYWSESNHRINVWHLGTALFRSFELFSQGFQRLTDLWLNLLETITKTQQNRISPPQRLCSSGLLPGDRLGCKCRDARFQKCTFSLSKVTWFKIAILIGGSIPMQTSPLPVLSCVFLYTCAKGFSFMEQKGLSHRGGQSAWERRRVWRCTRAMHVVRAPSDAL
jgi:hypothetical protein